MSITWGHTQLYDRVVSLISVECSHARAKSYVAVNIAEEEARDKDSTEAHGGEDY